MTPEQLFEENIKLAEYVAKKLKNSGDYEEIRQLAQIGLFKACRQFDPSYGHKFSSYAVPTIRNEIIRGHLEVRELVKIPRLITEDRVKVNRHIEDTQDVSELSKLTGVPPHRVQDVLDSFFHKIESFHQKINYNDDTTLEEMLGVSEDWDGITQLRTFLRTLEGREKEVVEMTLQDKPQAEIGQALGISQVHVSRILKKIRNRYEQFTSLEGELV